MTSTPRAIELHPPHDVLWITRTLEEAGFSTWVVGGAVRDELAGGVAGDWDLTTAARPTDVRRIFRRTVPLGVEYGTVGVVARSRKMYEVTTFRRDVETFGRKARVAFADSLEDDLARRDFTMNAIAWHPLTRELRDPHGGFDDLTRGVLRTVGNPTHRFEEDRLRVLRAMRFAGRFGLRIDEPGWRAARESANHLGALSAERVREELWKVLGGQRWPSRTLHLYAESGVLAALYPELESIRGVPVGEGAADQWEFVLRAVDRVSPRYPLVRVAALLHRARNEAIIPSGENASAERSAYAAAAARQLLRRLRASTSDTDRVAHLIAQLDAAPSLAADPPELRRWMRRVGRSHLDESFRLLLAIAGARHDDAARKAEVLQVRERVIEILSTNPPLAIADLAIDGTDLHSAGIPPGPLYGEILRDLLDRVTDDPALNRADTLLNLVRSNLRLEGET